MGGLGSGTWERENEKITMEECYILDVNDLARNGMLQVGARGSWHWEDQHGENPFAVKFSTDRCHCDSCRGRPNVVLSYRWEDWWGEDSEDVSLPIPLQTTSPNYGGRRWWFRCPLTSEGVPCCRRVAKLYLPPGERYFGCRICHDLTYRSCQKSHQLERLLSPERLERREARLEKLIAQLAAPKGRQIVW